MEFNRDSFEKALKECKIVRYENHFAKVVKSYLKNDSEQLRIAVVSKSFTAEEVGNMLATKFSTIEEAIHYFDIID